MRAFTPQRLAGSAYRTLGLSGAASQEQIDAAARRLRIWPDPNSVPPTAWDLPWLGPVARSKNDIEQAVAALSEPTTRVEERLMWFNGADPNPWARGDVGALDQTLRAVSLAKDAPSVHDFVLARLQLALLHDGQFTDSERWARVLRRMKSLAESDDYLSWSLEVEARGDFEKRAQIEEISTALKSFPAALSDSLAGRAEAALEDDDLPTASRILALLRATGSLESGTDCEKRILDRLEDLVERRSNHLLDDLARKFARAGVPMQQAQAFCGGAAKFYNESIDPVLTLLYTLAGSDSDRVQRGRTAAAKAMAQMGECWLACRRYPIAERTFEAALALAEGTAVAISIVAALERCRERGRVAGRSPPAFVRNRSQYSSFSSGSSGGWNARAIWLVIVLASFFIRGIVGISSTSSTTPSSSYIPSGGFGSHVRYAPDGRVITDDSPARDYVPPVAPDPLRGIGDRWQPNPNVQPSRVSPWAPGFGTNPNHR